MQRRHTYWKLRHTNWLNFKLLLSVVYVPASVLYYVLGLPLREPVVWFALVPLLFLVARIVESRNFIDAQIGDRFDAPNKWPVHTKTFPLYKFVDIYRGAQSFVEIHGRPIEIRSEHTETLPRILNRDFNSDEGRRLKTPVMLPRKVNYGQEVFLPSDTFWLLRPEAGGSLGPAIMRVRLEQYSNLVHLEVAAEREGEASKVIDGIMELATANSIYRNHLISVAFEHEVRDSYGDGESFEKFDLIFEKKPAITSQDIILDDNVKAILDRSIIDFHNRRDELMRVGLPGKRGVLFYGPPGTGKTFTSKYLSQQLHGATTVVATGHALAHVKSICSVAKMLQPSMVILEDVDLVFADRQINPYSTVLGEFMDQLDGFGEGEQVIFVLTTNAIERVETAIKDRPGRISQCIFFGPPNAALRGRYLRALLKPYDTGAVNMFQLIERTEGVSQAFLKELVFRAVQVATGAEEFDGERVVLTDSALDTALREMTTGGGRPGKRIIGFHVET